MNVYTAIDIHAAPERVWAVLTDNDAMASWNPVTTLIEGALRPGERVRVVFTLNGRLTDTVVTLLEAEAPRVLTWRGGIPWLLVAVHGFRLEPRPHGVTRVVQSETFTGPLAWLVPRLLGDLAGAYREVNLALKARCEASEALAAAP